MKIKKDEVLLDFTGFYFQLPIKLSEVEGEPTVKSVTEAAKGKFGSKGGQLTEVVFSDPVESEADPHGLPGGFLSKATVDHSAMTPHSRQIDLKRREKPPAGELESGVYSYDDGAALLRFIAGDGDVSFFPAWQYYLFRGDELLSAEVDGDDKQDRHDLTRRVIVPANRSAEFTPIEPGDVIRWRLVMIGGLETFLRKIIASMSEREPRMMQRVVTANTSALEFLSLSVPEEDAEE